MVTDGVIKALSHEHFFTAFQRFSLADRLRDESITLGQRPIHTDSYTPRPE
jgi:hypothetical protein